MSLHSALPTAPRPLLEVDDFPVAAWDKIASIPAIRLAPKGLLRHHERNSEIHAEGDRNDHFYRVVSGMARTCRFLADGRRQIDAFYKAGDLLGLESGRTRLLTAEAVDDCSLVAYPRLGVALCDSDGPAWMQMMELALMTAERATEHALMLGRRCAVERIAAFLIELDRPAHTGVIELVMNRVDIADYLGLTIETVSRTLTQLERDGVIAIRNVKTIVMLDGERLRALAL